MEEEASLTNYCGVSQESGADIILELVLLVGDLPFSFRVNTSTGHVEVESILISNLTLQINVIGEYLLGGRDV